MDIDTTNITINEKDLKSVFVQTGKYCISPYTAQNFNLDIADHSKNPKANLVIYHKTDIPSQNIIIFNISKTDKYVLYLEHSGLVLTSTNSHYVEQQEYLGKESQQWRIDESLGLLFRDKHGDCLTLIAPNGPKDGLQIITQPYTSAHSQSFIKRDANY